MSRFVAQFCSLLCAILVCILAGCSYHFQGVHSPLQDLGIHKIYVVNFRNATYRPGIEQLFTSAMVREIARSKLFKLVNSKEEADAILFGTVESSDSSAGATKSLQVGSRSVDVASEYNASVNCKVELRDRRDRQIFSQTISGNKVHQGAAELNDSGATAPLINDSEHRLASQFLAAQMMASVYQRMIDTF